MSRLYYNHLSSFLSADIDSSETTIPLTSPFQEGGVDIPNIYLGVDTMAVSVDTEVMYVTAYTPGALTATVVRGQEGSAAAAHSAGAQVYNTATKLDVGAPGQGADTIVVATEDSSAEWQAAADYICDGVDDQVQINQAIVDAGIAGNGSGRVLLAPNVFIIGAKIDIDYSVILEGAGADSGVYEIDIPTVITTDADMSYSMIECGWNLHLKNLRISSGYDSTAAVASLVDAYWADIITIENCAMWLSTTAGVPAIFSRGEDIRISRSHLEIQGDPFLVNASSGYLHGEISDCYLYGGSGIPSGDWPAFIVLEGWSPSATNFNESNGFFSIHHTSSDGNGMPLVRCQRAAAEIRIHDNVWAWDEGNDFPQIELVLSERIDIHDNMLTSSVYLEDSRDIKVHDNDIVRAGRDPIELVNSSDCLIHDNTIIDAGEANAATTSEIKLSGTSSNNLIHHNIGRTRDFAAPEFGIEIADGTCVDNMLRGNFMAGALEDNGTGTDSA